ncbi:replication initiator protein A [Staphylococcus epidermidis]|uniref:replication initiator protein A n=1 Tax=Staphylococcus aureus TaxID=1280 RepID=UPI00298B23E4|nr:replication initiator protein A [Staphylococcus epidermidis]MCG2186674.1 replication initiator protein A [Staphylococcus epidermidis]HDC7602903.1 replication initiator protein A [Staphylococcus aureus]HDH6993717.1 replication initiator protein A [Staphylococcus aureus]HEG8735929.1 replication initiator protein A [Staphylococcus aureus]
MSEQFYSIQEKYKEKFFQLPKVFFTNDSYKKMSNDAKISYAILKDRLELSIKNNWVDNNGNIYFIYTVTELEGILNCGNKKVAKIKKELENNELLIQKRQGLNKPNLLYLLKPVITKKDIYKVDQLERDFEATDDKEVSKRHVQKCQKDTSRNVKKTRQDMSKRHANDTDFSHTDFSHTDFSHTTTTEKNSSGSSRISKIIRTIQNNLNIEMNTKYKEELSKSLSKFNDDIINYAIEHTSLHAKNPKPFLLKILQKWEENNIDTVEQAKTFKVNGNVVKFSREKTPDWLNNREQQNKNKDEELDPEFEKEVKAFKQKLSKDWPEE